MAETGVIKVDLQEVLEGMTLEEHLRAAETILVRHREWDLLSLLKAVQDGAAERGVDEDVLLVGPAPSGD